MVDNLETESIDETQESEELEQSTEELEEGETVDTEEGEADESESDDGTTETEDSVAELLNLDGEEVTLETIREWKAGHMKDADYRRKTMAAAEQTKLAQSKVEEAEAIVSELETELMADFDADKLAELRDYDPSEYLKQKERLETRKNKIASARSKAAKAREDLAEKVAGEERQKLLKDNPEWVDAVGNTTEKYKADVSLMNNYLAESGWTTEEVAGIGSAKMWKVIMDAAKAKAAKSSNSALKKKVKKAPVVTKPQSTRAKSQQPKTRGSMLYGD